MKAFLLNCNTKIESSEIENNIVRAEPIRRAVARFYRDMKMVLTEKEAPAAGSIILKYADVDAENYVVEIEQNEIVVQAGDELGIIYALLAISEKYLGILPFWFWNDQKFEKKEQIAIPVGKLQQESYRVRYRGWFVNDEVLISHWDAGVDETYPWEMVFEALLRQGGNMVIPGTDKNSKIYAPLASDMGLWITHHHAEPLGAEMFARVYPKLSPSFAEHPKLFRQLWKEGIKKQREQKVIWNIGFRGQGDTPFWENDPAYDTPEKRGALISSIMREQYDMVREEIPDAVFCTNLYGEIMELYQQGCLSVPEDVIMIWADNGYGKMVSRRQGNHNPRVRALPEKHLQGKAHGTYYHVSFYDLQAANHITMLPNSMEFVGQELEGAYENGIRQFWIINSSNIKPHVYPLDYIGNLWRGEPLTAQEHLKRYLQQYYTKDAKQQALMQECMADYFKSTVAFGELEDEHAGEQFYNYVTRYFAHGWMKDAGTSARENLFWCTREDDFTKQIAWYQEKCEMGRAAFAGLLQKSENITDSALWRDSFVLQVKVHLFCLEGAVKFTKAWKEFAEGRLMQAFYLLGNAADAYEKADAAMRSREHDKWEGFYANDCLADVKQTAYNLRGLMRYIRNLGDGPDFYEWQREVIYSEEDRRVVLITNMENHMTDEELYERMKENTSFGSAEQ